MVQYQKSKSPDIEKTRHVVEDARKMNVTLAQEVRFGKWEFGFFILKN